MVKLDNVVNQLREILADPYTLVFLVIVVILYAIFSGNTLPPFMYHIFDNQVIVFIVLSSIAVIGNENLAIGFIVSLIFVIIMHRLNQTKIKEAFEANGCEVHHTN